MKTAYIDCIAGASGDMIIGSLIDAGLDIDLLREKLNLLNLKEFDIKVRKVVKNGFAASKFDVIIEDTKHARHYADFDKLINESRLDKEIKSKSLKIFKMMCEAEAKIHNSDWDKVHLHELGGVDTIVDVVGALICIDLLGIEKIVCSPLPVGRGFVKGAHGEIPLPAPATAALLKGIPLYGSEIKKELITPTGAALLRFLASEFGSLPQITVDEIGYGAGDRDLEIPNLLRVFIGDSKEKDSRILENLYLLETNIDDQNPEYFEYVMEQLFEKGALDVFLQPIQMKKNRPAAKLSVIVRPGDLFAVKKIIFKETSSIGIRQQLVERESLPREIIAVSTEYGNINIKVAYLDKEQKKFYPEYEDCKKSAKEKNISIENIYRSALYAVKLKFDKE